jgi:hypothetical protein
VDAAGGEAVNKVILNKRTETPKGVSVLKVEETGHGQRLQSYFPHCPSWKRGDDGHASVEVDFHKPTGTISLRVQEIPENYRGTKDVIVHLDQECVKALAAMIKEVAS